MITKFLKDKEEIVPSVIYLCILLTLTALVVSIFQLASYRVQAALWAFSTILLWLKSYIRMKVKR